MITNRGRMFHEACTIFLIFVAPKSGHIGKGTPKCNTNFTLHWQCFCYYIDVSIYRKQHEAKAKCNDIGGHLVAIEDEIEQQAVRSIVKNCKAPNFCHYIYGPPFKMDQMYGSIVLIHQSVYHIYMTL